MEWKNVRIFISSTFNDMHAERDYLVKHVFPELSEWCEERKLRLIDIDLRWGVTAEDSQNNHTVYACMHNIDESRPFFLCFLGQRRGWVPGESDLSKDTLEAYPGLAAMMGKRSITEMEVEHALLSPMIRIADDIAVQPEAVSHALFFLRDDNYTSQINDAQLSIFTNSADPDPDESDRKLSEFKEFIREKWDDTYDYKGEWDPAEVSPELSMIPGGADAGRLGHFTSGGRPLSEVITEALKKEIEEEFPDHVPSGSQTELERDIELQTFFAEQNCLGYIERVDDFDELREYVDGDSRGIMVIAAPAGQGKTSLLSRFSSDLRKKSDVRVFARSCGVTDLCSSVYGVFRSILAEAGCSVPPYEDMLIRYIEKVLSRLAVKDRKTVVIIDAVNQLPRGAEIFRWMPRVLPEGLKFIFSIKADEESREVISQLQAEQNTVVGYIRPFGEQEDKEAVINAYLSNYLKKLDEDQIHEICSLEASENPLYLKVLLSELRVFGTFRLLSEEIKRFGDTAVSAFDAVLARLESDMDHCSLKSEEYVPLLFGLLSASRAGLSEEEILRCVTAKHPEADEEGLAEALHVYLRQMRTFLTRREGRWDFFYESFRIASGNRYSDNAAAINRLLYECFSGLIREEKNLRRAYSEAAWHLYLADRDGLVPGDETCSLLLSSAWIQGKLNICGAESLIEDYTCIPEESCPDELLYLRRALRAGAHVLRDRPEQLAPQLIGRLFDMEGERIKAMLADLAGSMKYAWLEPLGKTLTGPLDPRAVTLSGHDADVTDAVLCKGYICTGDADGVVRIWDTDSWQCLRILPAHNKVDVRFAPKHDELITWGTADSITVFKKWDIYSGTLLATCSIDKRATRVRIFRDMLLSFDYSEFVSAHRLDNLDLIGDTSDLGLPEGYVEDYGRDENQSLKDSKIRLSAGDYRLYTQGNELVVLRKGVGSERQSDLPVSIVETLPDGSCAACATYGNDDTPEDKAFGAMFRINIYDPEGNKIKVIPVPNLSRLSVCGDRLIYAHYEDGQFIYRGRNEVIKICDPQDDFRTTRTIETLVGYFNDENGERKRMLLGTGQVLSMVMLDGDLFCLDNTSRLVVIRKDSDDFEWKYLDKPGFLEMDKQRLIRLGDEICFVGGLSSDNKHKDSAKTVFRQLDPKTLEVTKETYLEETVVGAVIDQDLAVLVCNRANDSILTHDGDAYVSVRNGSLTEELYRVEVDNSVVHAADYQIGSPIEKAGYSRKSRYGWISETTHPENHIVLADGNLFISTGRKILQLEAKTGEIITETTGEDLYFMGIALSGDTLLAGTSTGKVLRYAVRRGEKGGIAQIRRDGVADGIEFFALQEEDEDYYKDIVLHELDSEKRLEALDNVTDQSTLETVLIYDDAPAVRAKAAGKIEDQALLAYRAEADPSEVVSKAAIAAITDQDELCRYIRNMISGSRSDLNIDPFVNAVAKCENDRVLYEVCMIRHRRFWKKRNPAERIKSYEYQYATLCDHSTTARDFVIEAIDPSYEGELPKPMADRTMIYEDTNYISNRAMYSSDNEKLIMLQYWRHYRDSMADGRLKDLGSEFPEKYRDMSEQERSEYIVECLHEVARVAESVLHEDERVRRLLPEDVDIDSSPIYAAIAMFSEDPVKRLLAATNLSQEAMAYVGLRTLYNDVRIFLSRRIEDDRFIEAACCGQFPRYDPIAGTDQLRNPELKESFLNLLKDNARYDRHKAFVIEFMKGDYFTTRPGADWPVNTDSLLEEFLSSPNLDRGDLMEAIMLQHGEGCYDDSILILANAIEVGKRDPEFLRDLVFDPLTAPKYVDIFKQAIFSMKLKNAYRIDEIRQEILQSLARDR